MIHDVTELLVMLKDTGPAYLLLCIVLMLYLRAQKRIDMLQMRLLRLAESGARVNRGLEQTMGDPPPAAPQRRPPPPAVGR